MDRRRRDNCEDNFLVHRNDTKRSCYGTLTLRWLILTTIAAFLGCTGLAPSSEPMGGGINLEYLLGDRRPAESADDLLIDDPEYTEYLERKRWQDFQAYQEWRRRRSEQGASGNDGSN